MIDIRTHLVLTEHRLADVRRAQETGARHARTLRALTHERRDRRARRPRCAGVAPFCRLRALFA